MRVFSRLVSVGCSVAWGFLVFSVWLAFAGSWVGLGGLLVSFQRELFQWSLGGVAGGFQVLDGVLVLFLLLRADVVR